MDGSQLLTFAEEFQNLSAGNLTAATIPILGTPTITYGGQQVSIVQVDFAAMPGFIASVIGPSTAYTKAVAAAPGSVTVKVINAAGQNGAATRADDTLTSLGFKTVAPADQATSTITYIAYPAGMEAQAKALAAYVPGASVTASTNVTGVTLVLGSDGITVTIPSTTSTAAPTPTPTPTSPAKAFTATSCIN
jgi:hypothetical protein